MTRFSRHDLQVRFACAALVLLCGQIVLAGPPQTINLQGVLQAAGGGPVSGTHAFQLDFYELAGDDLLQTATGTLTLSPTGRYSIAIVPGAAVLAATQAGYGLAVDVDDNGIDANDFFPERVPIHSVPFALLSRDSERLGGHDASLYATVPAMDAALAGKAPLEHAHDNYWSLTGNVLSPTEMLFLGTINPRPLELVVGGQPALRLLPGLESPSLLGGHVGNLIHDGVEGGVIGGGGDPVMGGNQVMGNYGVVAGGRANAAMGLASAVGGGEFNVASAVFAVVAGGETNSASGAFSFVGGGQDNVANWEWATVGGGSHNTALNSTSTVVGGAYNRASGIYSMVAGGFSNEASGQAAMVGAGMYNQASGDFSFVGGGGGLDGYTYLPAPNVAAGARSVVGGGQANRAEGSCATVAGGRDNQARFEYDTVAGGIDNRAAGPITMAGTTTIPGPAFVGGGLQNAADGVMSVVAGGAWNVASGYSAFIGGGHTNLASATEAAVGGGTLNWAGGRAAAIAGGWYNSATGEYASVGGGSTNAASGMWTTVGGGFINTASGARSVVAGGTGNEASGFASTVGGGEWNLAGGAYGVIAGGIDNRASALNTSVGGGLANVAEGHFGTVAGGNANTASSEATIGGGVFNRASGHGSTIGGGVGNSSPGLFAVVPGGRSNSASGEYSLAAGYRAQANSNGAFVWADSTDEDFFDSGADTFNVRARNGATVAANSSSYGAFINNYGNGDGLRAQTNSSQGNNWAAVYAYNAGSSPGLFAKSYAGPAAYLDGNVTVVGTLTKGGGSFRIDHPVDPSHKYLSHSFVESPDMKNVYDGTVVLDASGEATVQLPDWFGALNRDFRYQLTCIGGFAPVYIAEEIKDNHFKIAGGTTGLKVSWMVTGIRQDAWANAHRIQVEEEKPLAERGHYLHPDAFGSSVSKGWVSRTPAREKQP